MNRPIEITPQVQRDLEAYTAEVVAARHEYVITAEHLCLACENRKRDGGRPLCWACRKAVAA